MRAFTELFRNLELTTAIDKKIVALVDYFDRASEKDKVWAIALFSHKRPKRTVTTSILGTWASELGNIPAWLFEETCKIVGDRSETIAKIVPLAKAYIDERPLNEWIAYVIELADKEDGEMKAMVIKAWSEMGPDSRFLFNKILTGGFRMDISQRCIVKALANHLGQEESSIAHKLMGNWSPATTSFHDLLLVEDPTVQLSKPYPFCLANAIDSEGLTKLGKPEEWFAEYKWEGTRGQIIHRGGEVYCWSGEEELVTHQYPEFQILKDVKESFVIDGIIVVFKEGEIRPFNEMQKRIGRKKVSKKMSTTYPVVMIAYDLMEIKGQDVRALPLSERREHLEKLISDIQATQVVLLSEFIPFENWSDLFDKRDKAVGKGAESLVLKSKSGTYKTTRKESDWYQWKVDPMTIDAVMLYAQKGQGRYANLFTNFTFAVRNETAEEKKLITFTKAHTGLTGEELKEITRFVRQHTIERFGPVYSIVPQLVFELAFEGIAESSRHKSGVALRSPRILRWQKEKLLQEINTLSELKAYIKK